MNRVRDLIREKGLSRQDLELLEEMLHLGTVDLMPLLENQEPQPARLESHQLAKLRRHFGLFLAFLNHVSDRRLGEMRRAMGLVIQHSLAGLGEMAKSAHRELLDQHCEPEWVVHLLELIASLRAMSTSLGSDEGSHLLGHWKAFLQENRKHFRDLFQVLGKQDPELSQRLNQEMKALNQALRSPSGRSQEHLRLMEVLLARLLPEETRTRTEPLLLVQHVIASLLVSLARPLDRGIHWPAVEQVRGSLQWLWNHLGWTLSRVEEPFLEVYLPSEVRNLLKGLRREHPQAFMVIARALASHLALLNLLEKMEPAANASVPERFAVIPTFFVVESELGRLAERAYHPRAAEQLPKGSEESLLLGAFLRQAVLSLLQDQATIRGLLQQTLTSNDVDQLAGSLDNLKALLISHQRQLMADLVGLYSPELRQQLFPDSPSLTEEGDRLRQRLRRLWDFLDPANQQIQLHLELHDLPRLALALGQVQNQITSFRRSPEFLLIRSQDRQEVDRLTQSFLRMLEQPEDIAAVLREAADMVGELLRFMDVFLLRINARIPLIRLDLNNAREAIRLARALQGMPPNAADRSKLSHRLIQTAKTLGVRDAQALSLLKRWVRAERGNKETSGALEFLASHLEYLAMRLEAALN